MYLLAFIWIVNYLAQKIGGQPILIDLNAVQKLDYQNMIRIDFANAEFVPTAPMSVSTKTQLS